MDYTNYLALGLVMVLTFSGVILIANLEPTTGQAYKVIEQPIRELETCGDGVCSMKETFRTCPDDCETFCFDSDGGIAPETKGYVNASDGLWSDHCLGNNTLIEYYCQEETSSSQPTPCDQCIDGTCIEIDTLTVNAMLNDVSGELYAECGAQDEQHGIDSLYYTLNGPYGEITNDILNCAGQPSCTTIQAFNLTFGNYSFHCGATNLIGTTGSKMAYWP